MPRKLTRKIRRPKRFRDSGSFLLDPRFRNIGRNRDSPSQRSNYSATTESYALPRFRDSLYSGTTEGYAVPRSVHTPSNTLSSGGTFLSPSTGSSYRSSQRVGRRSPSAKLTSKNIIKSKDTGKINWKKRTEQWIRDTNYGGPTRPSPRRNVTDNDSLAVPGPSRPRLPRKSPFAKKKAKKKRAPVVTSTPVASRAPSFNVSLRSDASSSSKPADSDRSLSSLERSLERKRKRGGTNASGSGRRRNFLNASVGTGTSSGSALVANTSEGGSRRTQRNVRNSVVSDTPQNSVRRNSPDPGSPDDSGGGGVGGGGLPSVHSSTSRSSASIRSNLDITNPRTVRSNDFQPIQDFNTAVDPEVFGPNTLRRNYVERRTYRRTPVEVRYRANGKPVFVFRRNLTYTKVPTSFYPSVERPNTIPMRGAIRTKNRLLRRLVALRQLRDLAGNNNARFSDRDKNRIRFEYRRTKEKYDTYDYQDAAGRQVYQDVENQFRL